MEPLEILKAELSKWEKAKKKSIESFMEGGIDLKTHEEHIKNLEPKISTFKYAIRVLETYM